MDRQDPQPTWWLQVTPGQTAAPGQTLAPALIGGSSGVREDPKTGALTPQTPIPVVTPKPGTTPVTTPASRGTKSGLATAAVCPLVCDFPRRCLGLCTRRARHRHCKGQGTRLTQEAPSVHTTRPLCTAFQTSHIAEHAESSTRGPAGCSTVRGLRDHPRLSPRTP